MSQKADYLTTCAMLGAAFRDTPFQRAMRDIPTDGLQSMIDEAVQDGREDIASELRAELEKREAPGV